MIKTTFHYLHITTMFMDIRQQAQSILKTTARFDEITKKKNRVVIY